MKYRLYHIRLKLILLLGGIFWLALAGRLFYIQVWKSDYYTQRARQQHERRISINGLRGHILDRKGVQLTANLSSYSLAADPSRVEDEEKRKIAYSICRVTGDEPSSFLNRLSTEQTFVWLKRKIDKMSTDGMGLENVAGLYKFKEMKRVYPRGTLAGHLIGHTDIDSNGIEAAELMYDDYLGGTPGWMVFQIDGHGQTLPYTMEITERPQNGKDVVLTIDAIYQAIAEDELQRTVEKYNAKSGTVVIMAPKTGEILAMANVPLYNPNSPSLEFARNRAITDLYEPGSTFKIVAAAAALERGVTGPEEMIFCENGQMSVPGGPVRDSHKYGWLSFREVIGNSSNIGMIKVAQRLGDEWLYKYGVIFGFGNRTGIDLPGEAGGVLRSPSEWSGRSLASVTIGQEVSVTVLQMATAYSAVANGGVLMRPFVLKSVVDGDKKVIKKTKPQAIRTIMSQDKAQTLTDLLRECVLRGTGIKAQIEGVDIAGKTGTAQRASEHRRGYAKGEFIASFVGFLPAADPELVCIVVVDRPEGAHWGGEVGAPAFKRIVEQILNSSNPPVEIVRRVPSINPVADGGVEEDSRLSVLTVYGDN